MIVRCSNVQRTAQEKNVRALREAHASIRVAHVNAKSRVREILARNLCVQSEMRRRNGKNVLDMAPAIARTARAFVMLVTVVSREGLNGGCLR